MSGGGIWTKEGCTPVWYAAASDCQTFGASWGANANAYSYICTGYQVQANGSYTMTTAKCLNGVCTPYTNLTRSVGVCDPNTDFPASPWNLTLSQGAAIGAAVFLIWATAWGIKALTRAIDGGTPER
jgi:hypothetical protein